MSALQQQAMNQQQQQRVSQKRPPPDNSHISSSKSDQQQQQYYKITKFMLRYFPPGFIIEYQAGQDATILSHFIELQNIEEKNAIQLVSHLQAKEPLLSSLNTKVLTGLVSELQSRLNKTNQMKFSLISSGEMKHPFIRAFDCTKHTDLFISTGGHYNEIKVWRSQTSSLLSTFPTQCPTNVLKFVVPSNKSVITSDASGSSSLIDIEKCVTKAKFSGCTMPMTDVLVSPLASFAVGFGKDQNIYLWELPNCELIGKLTRPKEEIVSMKFDGTGMILGGLDANGFLYMWDLCQQSIMGAMEPTSQSRFTCFDISYDGSFLAAGNEKGHVNVYSTDFKNQGCLYKHSEPVAGLSISSSVENIVSCSTQGDFFSIHDVVEGKSSRIESESPITGIGFTPKGDSVFINQKNHGCGVYSKKGQYKQMISCSGVPYYSRFSYDGDCLVLVDSNSFCYVYGSS